MGEEVEKHVLRKYELLQKLGKGAYGIVWKAIDKNNRQVVALKKCFDAFRNATDAQRTFREVMYLQELNGHSNIIRLLNVVKADNDRDIYLVFDFMGGRANELHDIESIKSPFANTMLESLPKPKQKPLEDFFPKASPEALDLIKQCFWFDPSKRISVIDALKHPYVAQFHNEKDEPSAPAPLQIVVDDNTKYSAADYRDRLYREIIKKKKEVRRKAGEQEASGATATAQQ
ncbi:hypothetical protein KRP22_009197 [Phytophthora ramorum]|nr:Extracellular signal-regulated kinase 2 [Phytophthora ramorum]